ncbi:hypothetical protein AB0D38_27060, partial [Streptomyces sp. NPDC048279]|uniref:hypothetical protein n=1 Tax=Streptomyces sp. NPDC048279 TaxID=3154714 RepID=UPI0034463D6C
MGRDDEAEGAPGGPGDSGGDHADRGGRLHLLVRPGHRERRQRQRGEVPDDRKQLSVFTDLFY